jgi:hypothetical protein
VHSRSLVLTVGAVLALMTACLLAQAAPGSIEVHVSVSTPVTVVLMSGNQIKAVGVVAPGKSGCLLQDIAPGKYALLVSAKQYKSVTRAVGVADGAQTEVSVELARFTNEDYKTLGRIVGFVKAADDSPVANATLVLMRGEKPAGAARPTNATGVYELEWYPPGTYAVMVAAPGFNTATYAGQQVAAGASTWLDVVLQKAE